MDNSLLPEVEAPKTKRRTLVVATGTGVVGVAAGALACVLLLPPRIRTVVLTSPPERIVEQVPVVVPAATPPPVTDVQIVFTVGDATYVALDTSELPKHGAPHLVEPTSAIAKVAALNVPDRWKHRTFIVDGTCEATVEDFALVARVSGNAKDASEELTEWTAKTVFEYGRPTLAARINGCTGEFARDATLPAITVLVGTNAPGDLADRAMERFVASDLVARAQDEWRDSQNDGNWYEADDAHVDTRVMRHPRTGVMWVVIHAYRFSGCGQVGGNIVGFFRVEEDGRLATAKIASGTLEQLDFVIDLEGDGELELVNHGFWVTSIERTNGDSVTSLSIATYGCGC